MAALDLPGFSRHRILQRRSERRIVQGIVEKLSLRPPLIERAVASFSGSDRQKILLARGLTRYVMAAIAMVYAPLTVLELWPETDNREITCRACGGPL